MLVTKSVRLCKSINQYFMAKLTREPAKLVCYMQE